MILSTIDKTSHTRERGEEIHWRCLARRGMLHSECEALDYVRLAPGQSIDLTGAEA